MTASRITVKTCPSKPAGRSGVKKKLLPILAFSAIICAALLPTTIEAASYYPGYTCHYRDIAGSCLNRQVQNPYFFSPQTYPFRSMYNAQSTNRHTWDNRYNNRNNYYRAYLFENEDDDNDYLDDKDDFFRYYNKGDRYKDGTWQWYFDEEDDTYRKYRYQSDNDYYHGGRRRHNNNSNYYEEYEHTRYICTGGDCSSTNIRY
ncbi:MAG: hypothetical protein QF793_02810 [Candidatus Peribacteraceae bacterium]|jgi:hypothetical protein|nr:hypothetical protein [Candidatus Peribacteraceae bacterium]